MSVLLTIEKFSHLAKFLVPLLTKATNQRFLQELIDGKAQCLPFFYGILTNRPPVIVKPYHPVAKTFLTNGIERTADGFAEFGLSLAIGPFQGAQAVVTS